MNKKDKTVLLSNQFSQVKSRLPRKKQHDSDKLVRSMDGPTWATTRPICSTWLSFGRRGSLWCVCTRMKILSTPTASTKNGITWNDFTNFSVIYLGNHYIGLKLLKKKKKTTGKHTHIQRWLFVEEIRVKIKFGNSFPGTVWMHNKFRIYIKCFYTYFNDD